LTFVNVRGEVEGVHANAAANVRALAAALSDAMNEIWRVTPQSGLLAAASPRLDCRAWAGARVIGV
jgi:hypothetical protein